MPQKDHILGIDYGDKRIGLAIAHNIAQLPRPLATLENGATTLQDITAVVERENIGLAVLGMPRSLDGGMHAQAERVETFGAQLAGVLPVPVTFVDETLTSVQAEQLLAKNSGRRKNNTGETIDAMAAALILDRYFDENRAGSAA